MPDVAPAPAALLWDMDGLLVDSEPLWTIAERELFAGWGLDFTPATKAAMVGLRMDAAVRVVLDVAGPRAAGETPSGVADRLLRRMAELFRTELPLLPGVLALLTAARDEHIPQALVSSSYRVLVDAVLAAVPGHPFAVAVAGDEVRHGKPHPEPYLTAAARLGAPAGRCVVLEDTPAGARAGAAAGASVVYCPSVAGAGEAEEGWWAVRSLTEVTVAALRERVATAAREERRVVSPAGPAARARCGRTGAGTGTSRRTRRRPGCA